MQELAGCVKAIKGIMTKKAKTLHARQDLQRIENATSTHVLAQPNRFEEPTTPIDPHNIQQVPRLQALHRQGDHTPSWQ
jgi:hypothetical protein